MPYGPHVYALHLQRFNDAGFMPAHYPGRENAYGVFLGSHGGSGKTPQAAVKACLKCCNIRHWWTIKGVSARAIADAIRVEMEAVPVPCTA